MTFRSRDLRTAAAIAIGILAPVLPIACPTIDKNFGNGGGGAGTGGGGAGGSTGEFGTNGVGGGFGGAGSVGTGMGSTSVTTTTGAGGGAAGCVSCAKAVAKGGTVCGGLSSDAYTALTACGCVGTCASACGVTLCKGAPAGLTCGACLVSACPDQQADCSVH
jgi:hypothetical protein